MMKRKRKRKIMGEKQKKKKLGEIIGCYPCTILIYLGARWTPAIRRRSESSVGIKLQGAGCELSIWNDEKKEEKKNNGGKAKKKKTRGDYWVLPMYYTDIFGRKMDTCHQEAL